MRAKIRKILEECIENGLQYGMMRAHKHTDNPTEAQLSACIELAIWYEIDERFDFERNLVDELIEGLDALKEKR